MAGHLYILASRRHGTLYIGFDMDQPLHTISPPKQMSHPGEGRDP
jgi:hypothetical protein